MAAPDTVTAFATLTGATLNISDLPDTLTVSQTLAGAGSVGRSTTNNLIQTLNFNLDQDAAQINSIKVTRESTSNPLAADSDTTSGGVKIWLDRNSDGSFSPVADAPVLAAGTFSSGAVVFDISATPINLTNVQQKVFVTLDIAATAQTNGQHRHQDRPSRRHRYSRTGYGDADRHTVDFGFEEYLIFVGYVDSLPYPAGQR